MCSVTNICTQTQVNDERKSEFLTMRLQMGAEQMTMKEAMKKMKEQTAQMALKAQQDAEAAAAERQAAESELGLTREALEAEQNKVKSVEVCSSIFELHHFHNLETRFLCAQVFLSLDLPCRYHISELE